MSDQPHPAAPAAALPTPSPAPTDAPTDAEVAEAKKAAELRERGEFLAFLDGLRRGNTVLEIARGLRDVVKAVRARKVAGSITITIKVKPIAKNATGAVAIVDDVKIKVPAAERAEDVRFTTAEGALILDHPDQVVAWDRDQLTGGGAR